MDQDVVIRRRAIEPEDLELIRQLIVAEGARGRSHPSNRLCAIWDWRQANGRYRQIACRDLLRRRWRPVWPLPRISSPRPERGSRRPALQQLGGARKEPAFRGAEVSICCAPTRKIGCCYDKRR